MPKTAREICHRCGCRIEGPHASHAECIKALDRELTATFNQIRSLREKRVRCLKARLAETSGTLVRETVRSRMLRRGAKNA